MEYIWMNESISELVLSVKKNTNVLFFWKYWYVFTQSGWAKLRGISPRFWEIWKIKSGEIWGAVTRLSWQKQCLRNVTFCFKSFLCYQGQKHLEQSWKSQCQSSKLSRFYFVMGNSIEINVHLSEFSWKFVNFFL